MDDGSKDNTAAIVEAWKNEGKIHIRFYVQENGGKHRAHNQGVRRCNTDWFICVDSDDYLTDDAVDIFIKEIGLAEKEEIGVIFPKYEMQTGFPEKWFKYGEMVHISDMYFKLGGMIETALLLKTEYLKRCMFPEFEGEKYLGEEIIYNELDKIGKLRASDAKVYCFAYREDGLTNRTFYHWKKNPAGMLALLCSRYHIIIASDADPARKCALIFKCVMNINALCLAAGKRIREFSPNMFLSVVMYIPSILFAHYRYGDCNG